MGGVDFTGIYMLCSFNINPLPHVAEGILMVATSGGHGGKQYNCRAHRPANIYWEIFIKCPIWKNPGYVGDNRPVRFSSAELLIMKFCGSAG